MIYLVFLDDSAWNATLRDIFAALRPGGYLAFETRNPDVRSWERWNRETTYSRFESPHGPVETWVEVDEVKDKLVRFNGHNLFVETGDPVACMLPPPLPRRLG